MKIILLGDLHLGVKQNSEVLMQHQRVFFEFLFQYMKQNNINTILQLGDLFDQRKTANYKTLQFAFDTIFDYVERNNIEFHTLIGNHDVFYRETLDITSSDLLLRNYNNVYIHNKCSTLTFDQCTFDIIPWICEQNAQQCFQYIEQSNSDYCLGHFAIDDFPILGNNLYQGSLKYSTFNKYKHVYTGHFHQRSNKYNITYVGVPYQLTWSDVNNDVGFDVFDTQTRSTYHVTNDNRYYTYLSYNANSQDFDQLISQLVTDHFIKVIVNDKNDTVMYNQFLQQLFDLHPADVKIIDKQLLDIQNAEIDFNQQSKSTLDIIIQCINQSNIEDKSRLINFMSSLYNDAIHIQDTSNVDD